MIYFSTKWLDVRTLGLLSNSSCPFSNDIPPNEGCMCYIMTSSRLHGIAGQKGRPSFKSVFTSNWNCDVHQHRHGCCGGGRTDLKETHESLTSRTKSITHKAGKARQVEADWQHSRTEHQLTEELILPSACLRRAKNATSTSGQPAVSASIQKRQQRTVGHQSQSYMLEGLASDKYVHPHQVCPTFTAGRRFCRINFKTQSVWRALTCIWNARRPHGSD